MQSSNAAAKKAVIFVLPLLFLMNLSGIVLVLFPAAHDSRLRAEFAMRSWYWQSIVGVTLGAMSVFFFSKGAVGPWTSGLLLFQALWTLFRAGFFLWHRQFQVGKVGRLANAAKKPERPVLSVLQAWYLRLLVGVMFGMAHYFLRKAGISPLISGIFVMLALWSFFEAGFLYGHRLRELSKPGRLVKAPYIGEAGIL